MAINRPMYNDLPQRAPMILERFRAILKDREEDLRISDEEVVSPDRDEIARLYENMLSELTYNSKPVITDLTIIAGEQREHGEGIADAICARIVEVPDEQKLPALYLLDSIVKNIGHEYIKHFSRHLPEVFCEAYWQVQQNLHPPMRHLFSTWTSVFPHQVLQKIESQLQFSLREKRQSSGVASLDVSESPRPTHGIHVNPKYLEGRCQLEQSTVDKRNQHLKQASSDFEVYSHRPSIDYDEYDSDNNGEEIFSQFGTERRQSSGCIPPSFVPRPPTKSTVKSKKLDSPQRNGYSADGFLDIGSSTVSAGKVSPAHGLEETVPRDNGTGTWKRKHWSNDKRDVQDPRALIDAYGQDDRERPLNDLPVKVARLDLSGIKGAMGNRAWQNIEEEEFDWEDMSPTLVDRSRSSLPALPVRAPVQRRNNWPPQLRFGDPSTRFMEERIIREPILSHSCYEPTVTARYSMTSEDVNRPSFFAPRPVYKEKFSHLPNHPTLMVPFNHPRPFGGGVPLYNEEPPDAVPILPLISSRGPFHLKAQPSLATRGHDMGAAPPLLNQVPYNRNGLPIARIPNAYPHLRVPPPLPLPPPPVPPQLMATLQAHLPLPPPPPTQPSNPAFSGLITTLMAQGLISLQSQTPKQDALGLDFDPEALKVRHEHAIKALYADLPRQCTTCGLRFKSQEDHSGHMDWHVTKNRASKSRKQNTSRRWFVTSAMWLSTAESSGVDTAPGFLPSEAVVEQKEDDEEMAVPVDEEQDTCALCGERFEDFYCDETDEWMYRGAVYMNALDGASAGQFGPIIHTKCRSESGAGAGQGLTQSAEENREINERKQEWR